jgi:hypothetical protein
MNFCQADRGNSWQFFVTIAQRDPGVDCCLRTKSTGSAAGHKPCFPGARYDLRSGDAC